MARAASHRPQKSATRRPYKRGPKAALGLGSRIRGRIGVGIGIGIGTGNCIGIGNGYRVRCLGKSGWRERKTIRRDEPIKSNGQCSNGFTWPPRTKSNYPPFALLVTKSRALSCRIAFSCSLLTSQQGFLAGHTIHARCLGALVLWP